MNCANCGGMIVGRYGILTIESGEGTGTQYAYCRDCSQTVGAIADRGDDRPEDDSRSP